MADLENVIKIEGLPTENATSRALICLLTPPIARRFFLSGNILLSWKETGVIYCLSNVLFLIFLDFFFFFLVFRSLFLPLYDVEMARH